MNASACSVSCSRFTPFGLHFGEGPLAHLSSEPMAAPVFAAGTALMQALIARSDAPV